MTTTLTSLFKEGSKHKPSVAPGKVSSHWKLLKSLINTDEQDEKSSNGIDVDKFPKVISHGIHHEGKIDVKNTPGQTLKFVALNSTLDRYATINNAGRIIVATVSGKVKRIKSDECYKGMIFATKSKQCICWGDNDKLKLMNESFKPVSTSQSVAVIKCAVYNKSTHEVITAGDGNITCWSFRYGGKFLMPRKVITESLENCLVSRICLEDSLSKSQRCFISTGTSIASFNVLEGKCLSFLKNRHVQEITCLVFFNPLKYLISAAKDGSIKVWNDDGCLEIAFVGHHGCVNGLAIYPFGQFIISASSDMTLRVWSLEAKDEVDRMQCDYPVGGIGTVIGNDHLFSFTSEGIDLWKIKHIHTAQTLIGCKVKSMKQTTHPKAPLRIVCICADAAVRIISGKTGNVITTSLVPDLTTITDAVYSAGEDLLFTLLINGKILKSSTVTNPCSLLETWECENLTSPCTCLCLYEYIFEDLMAGTAWQGIIQAAKTYQANESTNNDTSNDRTLLLGGCVDGYIVVFDWKDKKNPGKVIFKIEAHRDEIVSMISNPKIDQVVSSGLDNIIKIWRLFPFAEEALAPLMTLYFDELPRHLCVSHHRLLVALYERSRANYAVTVYKTTQKERFDHSTKDDHGDEVISVSSCPKMRLFATASLDGSVRIWDESNRLKRVIKLNATPTALCFCSERGDIMVAIGKSLHRVKCATYLPQSYVYRMVSMEFKDSRSDPVIPIDDKIMKSLSTVDQLRVTKAQSFSSTLNFASDPMADDETEEKKQEARCRSMAIEKIQERENDLKKLRDGELRCSKKKQKMDDNLQNEAFEKYLSLFYNRSSFTLPENSDDERELPVYKDKDIYVPDVEPNGFFCIDHRSSLKNRSTLEDEKNCGDEQPCDVNESIPPSRLRSYSLPIINEEPSLEYDKDAVLEDTSVELFGDRSTLSPTSSDTKNKPRTKRKSSSASKKHRLRKEIFVGKSSGTYPVPNEAIHEVSRASAELAMVEDENGKQYEAIVIAPDGYIPNSVVAALFDDIRSKEEVEVQPEEVIPYRPPQLTLAQLLEIQQASGTQITDAASELSLEDGVSSRVSKVNYDEQLRRVLRDTPSPEILSDEENENLPDTPPPIEEAPQSKITPLTATEYFAARNPLRSPLPVPRRSPSPIIERKDEADVLFVTPREPTPVFQPEPRSRTPSFTEQAPLPHFITQFIGMKWFDKLFPNANPSTFPKPWTMDAFVGLLLIFLAKTSDYELKQHLCAAIILLRGQEPFDESCVNQIINTLTDELNISSGSLASWNVDTKQFVRSALQLLKMMKKYTSSVVAEFMSHYILGDEEVRLFVVDIFTEIGVQEANRYFLRELDEFDTWGIPENSVKAHVHRKCVDWLEKWLAQFKEHIRTLAGKINRARSGHVVRGTKDPKTPSQIKGILKGKESKTNLKQTGVSWNFQTMGDAAAENAGVVDAINYFSEMQLQSEIEKAKARKHSLKRSDGEDEKARNTVLILPAIDKKPSLARLGETHCSNCHPERETALSAFLLPPIHQAKSIVVNNIALRLKTITLNPFPTKSDAKVYESFQHHELLTLRSSQKYFIPSRSYVQPELVK